MALSRPLQPMPDFVAVALEARGLREAFDARPPYQRNDYLGWINRAKKQDTKEGRLAIMLRELDAGRGYMGMDWEPRQ